MAKKNTWGTKVTTQKGKKITLLNPQEKRQKFFQERLTNTHLTNDMICKTDKAGNCKPLTDTEAAYRSGYERAIKDQNRLYRAKHPKYVSKYPENIKAKN